MKILVLGANGFLGSAVTRALSANHKVIKATRRTSVADGEVYIDLQDKSTILNVLKSLEPDVIVNCAGVVYSGADVELNQVFTKNLLESVVEDGLKAQRIIISGSAAEYGVVDKLPVSEDAPKQANAGYGLSKAKEVSFALKFAKEHDLPVVVARIFNPIGLRMHAKFLISGLIRQIKELQAGDRQSLEVSRLDSRRDYIHVDDLAKAIQILVEKDPKHDVYNVGSGISTTNQELLDMVLNNSKLKTMPVIVETAHEPEPQVASQADITRIKQEFGWKPTHSLPETVKEIVDAEN